MLSEAKKYKCWEKETKKFLLFCERIVYCGDVPINLHQNQQFLWNRQFNKNRHRQKFWNQYIPNLKSIPLLLMVAGTGDWVGYHTIFYRI